MTPKLPGLPTFSALMLCAVMSAWLSLWGPISIEALWRWQTLIAAAIAGVGIFAASWNVTRQMRLAARGREQDRIERELPGIRSASILIERFVLANMPMGNPERVLLEYEEAGLNFLNNAEFTRKMDDMLPATPDGVRRELVQLLHGLRSAAIRLETRIGLLEEAKRDLREADKLGGDLTDFNDRVAASELECAMARTLFAFYSEEVDLFDDRLDNRITAERYRLDHLRNEQERFLKI